MAISDFIADLLIFVVIISHIIIAPYTKVEESFNLQAMHDILHYNSSLDRYDHHEFPGVVPRTFVGAIVTSVFAWPWHNLLTSVLGNTDTLVRLYLVRICLGVLTAACLSFFRSGLSLRFGREVGVAFSILVSLAQFHLPFYASRPLPNTFALQLTTVAFGFLLRSNIEHALALLTVATVLFRFETVLVLGPLTLELWLRRQIGVVRTLVVGVAAALVTLAVSVPIDSLLWRRWLWPEAEVLYFNTILNQSHQWGTSPWHWYATSALPRALLCSLIFAPFGALLDNRTGVLWRPAVVFIALYSFLPHKELRFVFYSLPLLTACAAVAVGRAWRVRAKNVLPLLLVVGLIGASVLAVGLFIYSSAYNYPCGHAFAHLHRIRNASTHARIHIDVFCAMGGVSRFGEQHRPSWLYSKDETPNLDPLTFDYDYLLWHNSSASGYRLIHSQAGFDGIQLRGRDAPRLRLAPQAFVLERIRDSER